jgi:hypothetical protein
MTSIDANPTSHAAGLSTLIPLAPSVPASRQPASTRRRRGRPRRAVADPRSSASIPRQRRRTGGIPPRRRLPHPAIVGPRGKAGSRLRSTRPTDLAHARALDPTPAGPSGRAGHLLARRCRRDISWPDGAGGTSPGPTVPAGHPGGWPGRTPPDRGATGASRVGDGWERPGHRSRVLNLPAR